MTPILCLSGSRPDAAGLFCFPRSLSGPPDDLVVHEWGTFTSIAGPDGNRLDWQPLNGSTDLPPFVCRFGVKSVLRGTVRMESRCLYFHSSKEAEFR